MDPDIPLYIRIRNEIRDRVISAVYQDKIEGELSLASEFGVARGTVKQAIESLVEDGLLYRRQGKGTYVNQDAVSVCFQDIPDFFSGYLDEDNMTSEIISIVPTNAELAVSEAMNVSIGTPLFKIDHKVIAEDGLLGFVETYINGQEYPDISALHFDEPLYAQLRKFYGIAPVTVEDRFDHYIPTNIELALFNLDKPEVFASIQRKAKDVSGNVLVYSNTRCRATSFSLIVDAKKRIDNDSDGLSCRISFHKN
ncbi:GntR family transcriptional regulator [Vibrio hepatarius]|uniref:GntR family transcriptional regulator n=1 Tax=Vibrio hepatarius TaxID=171383 RepID=UPI00142D6F62|nr:GntR family transcriptional regulator [Vibrio hepatarius]NIY83108.1 GntR family transcriptional regulator [Vibrio hepatarius]